jgi:hypothetical protein
VQVSPRSDYPVRVRPRGWEEDPRVAGYYDGVYDVTLNQMVTVTFVPDLGPRSRPFDRAELPADLDDIADSADARLEAVLFADRAVTADSRRAGTHEPLPIPPWRDEPWARPGTVFYVTPEQFAELADDLETLSREHGALHSDTPVSALRGHVAVDFVERLLADPAFGDEDLLFLRDPD